MQSLPRRAGMSLPLPPVTALAHTFMLAQVLPQGALHHNPRSRIASSPPLHCTQFDND